MSESAIPSDPATSPAPKPRKVLVLWNDPDDDAASQAPDLAQGSDTEAENGAAPPPVAPSEVGPLSQVPMPAAERPPAAPASPASEEFVGEALRRLGYRVTIENLDSDVDRVAHAVVVHRPDLIFNLVDNFCDSLMEHVAVAGLYDLYGYPFTGGDQLNIGTCQERARTHLILRDSEVPVPQFAVVRDLNAIPSTDEFRFPIIVTNGFDDNYRAEGEACPLWSREEVEAQLRAVATDYEMPLLLEEFINERHIHAIVLGNKVLEVLPLIERVRDDEGIVEFNVAQLELDQADDIRQLARRSCKATDCRDYAVIDFALDADGEVHVVDVRPLFDLGPGSVFAAAADHSEHGYDGTLGRIVRHALARTTSPDAEPAASPTPISVSS